MHTGLGLALLFFGQKKSLTPGPAGFSRTVILVEKILEKLAGPGVELF